MFLVQYLWSEVWIGTDDPRSRDLVFTGIMEDGGRTEIDQFDDIVGCHDAIIEFEIPMGETHLV